jgi:hypothetical protein
VTQRGGLGAKARAAVATAAAVAAFGAVTGSAAADVVLGSATCSPGSLSGCAGVSAYGDALLWSSFDPASGLYRLVAVRSSGSAPTVLPAAGRPVPFEADLGPDASGRPVAVYGRCAGEAGGPATGCALYRFDLATGRETRPLAAVVAPAPLAASTGATGSPIRGRVDPMGCAIRPCAR